jgi:AbiV family abortive infection protein
MAGPLDAVTARAFVGAVTRNAHELSTDAGVLLAHGRSARAHALAVAAMEEIGKASIAQDDAGITKGRKWKHGRPGHADKLLAARQFYSFVTMVRDRGEINIDEWFADEHDFAAMSTCMPATLSAVGTPFRRRTPFEQSRSQTRWCMRASAR